MYHSQANYCTPPKSILILNSCLMAFSPVHVTRSAFLLAIAAIGSGMSILKVTRSKALFILLYHPFVLVQQLSGLIFIDMSDRNGSIPAEIPASTSETTRPGSDEKPLEDEVFAQLQSHPYMGSDISLLELIRKTDYLQRYPSWLAYCGPENKKTFSPTYIARNDTIWVFLF
ncbi:unnamed protein product [Dicrocoelium dendriticum]|nr:unnamed protein product [Dicrocoelium dendriticum]